MDEIHLPQLVIFVGSRLAGRMHHLDRLIQEEPERYQPLVTITTREERKDGDETWFRRMSQKDVLSNYSIHDMLTYFQEGEAHYFVLQQQLLTVQEQQRQPLVGMNPQGLERLMTRENKATIVPFTAIVLQPADEDAFRELLQEEYGLEQEIAEEEARRAVRMSTLPPVGTSSGRSSIIPVPILGTAEDIERIDEALRSIVTP